MDHRIIDILVYLAKSFHSTAIGNGDGLEVDFDGLVVSLQNEGYSQSEIDSALNWYFENALPFFSARTSNNPRSPARRWESPSEFSSRPKIPKSIFNKFNIVYKALVED